jgi:hypothetical protein
MVRAPRKLKHGKIERQRLRLLGPFGEALLVGDGFPQNSERLSKRERPDKSSGLLLLGEREIWDRRFNVENVNLLDLIPILREIL